MEEEEEENEVIEIEEEVVEDHPIIEKGEHFLGHADDV